MYMVSMEWSTVVTHGRFNGRKGHQTSVRYYDRSKQLGTWKSQKNRFEWSSNLEFQVGHSGLSRALTF